MFGYQFVARGERDLTWCWSAGHIAWVISAARAVAISGSLSSAHI